MRNTINWENKMTSRFYTKPLVAINFDTTGSSVILGRAESAPHANRPDPAFAESLVAEIEKSHPNIQVYIEYRAHTPLVTMSRAAQRACGLDVAQMSEFVDETIRALA